MGIIGYIVEQIKNDELAERSLTSCFVVYIPALSRAVSVSASYAREITVKTANTAILSPWLF